MHLFQQSERGDRVNRTMASNQEAGADTICSKPLFLQLCVTLNSLDHVKACVECVPSELGWEEVAKRLEEEQENGMKQAFSVRERMMEGFLEDMENCTVLIVRQIGLKVGHDQLWEESCSWRGRKEVKDTMIRNKSHFFEHVNSKNPDLKPQVSYFAVYSLLSWYIVFLWKFQHVCVCVYVFPNWLDEGRHQQEDEYFLGNSICEDTARWGEVSLCLRGSNRWDWDGRGRERKELFFFCLFFYYQKCVFCQVRLASVAILMPFDVSEVRGLIKTAQPFFPKTPWQHQPWLSDQVQ